MSYCEVIMLVKINARGKGGGSGPIDYLLGKDRQRELARVLRGDPEETRELINSLDFSRNYTSGTLSFEEENIPETDKQKLMDSFETYLLAGLGKNQFTCLWVEHRDKGRLELNFVIPNVELQSGKRLQPYYDKVDRKRVNAWQQIINDQYGYSDPHDPSKRRFQIIPSNLSLDRKKAVEAITRALAALVDAGVITNRNDVITELKANGFEVARETKNSISIKDQNNKNIRLKGALYERYFKCCGENAAEIRRTIEDYRECRQERINSTKQELKKEYQAKCKYNRERYRTKSKKEPEKTQSLITETTDYFQLRNSDRNITHNRDLTNNQTIKYPVIKEVNEHVRNRETIAEILRNAVRAVRAAVFRSKCYYQRTKRANNITIEQYKQRKMYIESSSGVDFKY